ncbi:hypothetical protein ETB97_009873 [Aspergillus alliaceus]|uniref:Uncharacterized protein n=1 Tax=Petromyces alliaceus TaxID=209559 RepID=A0A8H6EBR1_PETAA|nr:hypothetical protein ETB97_009873 [Aspergillus burnettii]
MNTITIRARNAPRTATDLSWLHHGEAAITLGFLGARANNTKNEIFKNIESASKAYIEEYQSIWRSCYFESFWVLPVFGMSKECARDAADSNGPSHQVQATAEDSVAWSLIGLALRQPYLLHLELYSFRSECKDEDRGQLNSSPTVKFGSRWDSPFGVADRVYLLGSQSMTTCMCEIHVSVFLFKAFMAGALSPKEQQSCPTLVRLFISMLKMQPQAHLTSLQDTEGYSRALVLTATPPGKHIIESTESHPHFPEDFPDPQAFPFLESPEAQECPDAFLSNLPFLRGRFPDPDNQGVGQLLMDL